MLALLASLLISTSTTQPLPSLPIQQKETFAAVGDHFELNGKPWVIRSGEMHYPRIPHQYWRSRFKMAKAMGLNTICTYVFWNLHEPVQGKWDFSGDLDLANYIKTADEEGLKIILRPGPYICTELDFGGLPAWLLADRTMKVRSRDPKFLAHTDKYFAKLGQLLKPMLIQNGGPIIMTQVENEYGSYGNDHVYTGAVRDSLIKNGFTGQLSTSDGPGQGMLQGGTLPGIPATINFGGGAPGAFAELAKFRTGVPRMIGEYWAGWFDHWGRGHNTSSIEANVKDIRWCLQNDVSFNLYMFHGGTNFAFMQGSNGGANDYNVDVTSYDYDSALDEAGRTTPKYEAFRGVIFESVKEPRPAIPSMPAIVQIAPTKLKLQGSLLGSLPKPTVSKMPRTFEDLGQAYGIVVYETTLPTAGKATLTFPKFGDYVIVYLDGKRQGVLDRRKQQKAISIDAKAGSKLQLVVEALSRVNFGGLLPTERKGIDGEVKLGDTVLTGWSHYRFPLSTPPTQTNTATSGPKIYSGTLNVPQIGDTYLDTRGWNKGFVWINGHNLGRYWKIGPQQTLFVPGVWLKKGANQVTVYDDGESVEKPILTGIGKPILNEVEIDYTRLHRKPGQSLDLAGLTQLASGELAPGSTPKTIPLQPNQGVRYLVLEALSEQNGSPYTTLAELYALDPSGKELDRTKWKIVYADSEEIGSENGSADNIFDLQPTTIWHTQWSGGSPRHPHQIVIDLGSVQNVASVRLHPRIDGPNGIIKGYRIFGSTSPMKGL